MEHKTDHELMQAYMLGHYEAFETLYMRYRGRLYVYAYSLLKRVDEAQDAMHEVFTKLIGNTDAFSRLNKVSSFLFTVCRNHCLNILQSRKLVAKEPGLNGFKMLKAPSPLQEAAKHEEAQRLNAIIGALPRELREALVLKVFSGLTFKQIARTTGRPQGTVATRYRSAINRLRLALQTQTR